MVVVVWVLNKHVAAELGPGLSVCVHACVYAAELWCVCVWPWAGSVSQNSGLCVCLGPGQGQLSQNSGLGVCRGPWAGGGVAKGQR